MGVGCCKLAATPESKAPLGGLRVSDFRKPRWKSEQPMTLDQIQSMREEFWDTEPHYGGDRVIWDALRAAAEADIRTANLILQSAGIVIAAPDMTIYYDERGRMYVLPKYVLSLPTNILRTSSGIGSRKSANSIELPQLTASAL